MANSLTGGFDLVFQVREDVINSLYAGVHRAGTLQHHVVDAQQLRGGTLSAINAVTRGSPLQHPIRNAPLPPPRAVSAPAHRRQFGASPAGAVVVNPQPDTRIELIVNAPAIELVPSTIGNDELRAIVRARVFYWQRPIGDAADVGSQAAVDVAVRARIVFPAGDPSPLTAAASAMIDWSETQPADITVYTSDTSLQQQVRNALLDLIRARGSAEFSLASLSGFGANAFGSWAFAGPAGNVVSFGLRMGARSASRDGLGINFIQDDWAVALSSEFILDQVTAALHQRLGPQLPPPLGTGSITLSSQLVCVVPAPWPLQGCLVQATQSVVLDSLSVSLSSAGIAVAGTVRQTTDLWWVPQISANWTTTIKLTLDSAGSIGISVTEAQVQLNEWYAVIADTLSGGAIGAIVRDGIANALRSGPNSAITARFSDFVGEAAAAGRVLDLDLTLTPVSIEHRTTGIIVHGHLAAGGATPPPVAAFDVIAGGTGDTLILNAGTSWSPGGTITEFDWTYGDGTQAALGGVQAGFIAMHQYNPGSYTICLTVKDSLGRTAQSCKAVAPGILRVVQVSPAGAQWNICSPSDSSLIPLAIQVSANGPVSGCVASLSGQGWRTQATTGTDGVASVTLDPNLVRTQGALAVARSAWAIGAAQLSVTKVGYASFSQNVWLLDCESHRKVTSDLQSRRSQTLDRLAGYAALQHLLQAGDAGTRSLGPLQEVARSIASGVDVLNNLMRLLEVDASVLPLQKFFGIQKSGIELSREIERRLTGLWDAVDASAHKLQLDYERHIGP